MRISVATRSSSERSTLLPVGRDLELISLEARDDVHVKVEDVLKRGLAVGDEDVDPLAADAAGTDRLLHAHRDAEGVRPGVLVHVGHRRRVLLRDEQDMPGVDGMEVHEPEEPLVFEDDARLCLARDEGAEHALAHVTAIRAPVSR